MDDCTQRVRLRAYLIWEREGRPEGRDAEHWRQAEREVAQEEDAAGVPAAREYEKGVKEFAESGRVERAVKGAQHALQDAERDDAHRRLHAARAEVTMLPVGVKD
jgi:hypothetical protein